VRMPSREEFDLRPSGRLIDTPNNKKSLTGGRPEKRCYFMTNEAGMCMKTNNTTT